MLHITNGDVAAGLLRVSGLGGDVIAWADVLHEGPIQSHLEIDAQSRRRAEFIAEMGWESLDRATRLLAIRDARVAVSRADDEVVLWFEHDLYDQLQLVQVLAVYARMTRPPVRISLVQADDYLGLMPPSEFGRLFTRRVPIGPDLLAEGAAAWRALGRPEPTELERLGTLATFRLRHLAPALMRLLEELPAAENGLARSEQQLVEVLGEGPRNAADAFRESQTDREQAVFMGDTVFVTLVRRLAGGAAPLIELDDPGALDAPFADRRRFFRSTLSLTAHGRAVLVGERDWASSGAIDRWVGGVRLAGEMVTWRWSRARRRVVRARAVA